MDSNNPNHIVAIGASAGGIDELISFFDHTPSDGISYLVVQHLSAEIKSRMAEILNKHSKLKLNVAEDGMKICVNQVYLIPSDSYMTISECTLFLSKKGHKKGPHLTINLLFSSLATDLGNKAIGIVLSGMGSDGTEGIKTIKQHGGMVMARNPNSTDFGSMPSSAIATGLVDYILEPAQMPKAIEDYIFQIGHEVNHNNDDIILDSIIAYISDNLPHDFSEYKKPTILRRTIRRAAFHNINSLARYLEYLKKNPEEVKALSKEYLISVTSFFRDKEAYDCIQKTVLPDIISNVQPGEELKMWVAGCATGEEAYSLAIMVHELIKENNKEISVKIFATDIDTTALTHAAKGIYKSTIAKDVSAYRLENYFFSEGETYRIIPQIRKMVIFAQHDLVKNPPYCNMHFISCRNLLIYITPILQKKIFSMLLFGLRLKGYLFLGSTENPLSIIHNLEIINRKWKIYKNLAVKKNVILDVFSLPEVKKKELRTLSHNEENVFNPKSHWGEMVSSAYALASGVLIICIDDNNKVLKTYGDTSAFLIQKNFNTNLVELLPRTLAIAYNTLRTKVLKTYKSAKLNVECNQNRKKIKVNILVMPLSIKKLEKDYLIVTLKEVTDIKTENVIETKVAENIFIEEYTLNLEEEIKELREKLYYANEKLDASNENLQSYNEEILSSTEEMQSTNEEMQSVNEELHTLNADYQNKNKELIDINDDLNNYFRSNINGQLFVNNDLRLMKYSPGTVKQIPLLPSDIGRPLNNISTNIKFETLIEDIKQVLLDGLIITKEVQTENGKWYQVMTMPYIQSNHSKNGAIITFNDISTIKKNQIDIQLKNTSLLRVNEDLENFTHSVSHDLLAPLGNLESSIGLIDTIDGEQNKELKQYLNIINLSVKKFRSLIVDISVIAKIDSDISKEINDIREVIKDVEWSLMNQIKESKAVINLDLKVKTMLFSKKNFRSIIFNLISNAIKFKSNLLPVLDISSCRVGDQIQLVVQDNGKGMNEKDIQKIFKKYGRLDTDAQGQGIGLYLAKKIIDAAGGSILVESAPNAGSKFTINLPG